MFILLSQQRYKKMSGELYILLKFAFINFLFIQHTHFNFLFNNRSFWIFFIHNFPQAVYSLFGDDPILACPPLRIREVEKANCKVFTSRFLNAHVALLSGISFFFSSLAENKNKQKCLNVMGLNKKEKVVKGRVSSCKQWRTAGMTESAWGHLVPIGFHIQCSGACR